MSDLVLRSPQDYFRHYRNEISNLDPDLVLREIPGNFYQSPAHPQRRRAPRMLLARARGLLGQARRLKAAAGSSFLKIVGIAPPPRGLSLLA